MSSPFPSFPVSGITFPNTPLMRAANDYCAQHTSPCTVNHALRSAAFALILTHKLPPLANLRAANALDTELVALAVIMHDLGWATTPSLRSADKRFEVDGANLAREFVRSHAADATEAAWDKHRLQLLWDAIALHTSPSIAHHKEPEVFAAQIGIMVDFFGPKAPRMEGLVTVEEYTEVVTAFPRLGFQEEMKQIMCGLCRDKKETVWDNFVADFGCKFGLDGKGEGKEEFQKECEQRKLVDWLMSGLDGCKEIEKGAGLPS